MKEFFKGIWTSKATTFAGAVVALGIWLASDAVDVPDYISLPAAGIAVVAGALYPGKSE
jgi:hypothetical protein